MNKKSIAHIKKQFKPGSDLLNIKDILFVYVQKETGSIYHQFYQPFDLLDHEQQDVFLANFNKVLSGKLDSKLFELKLKHSVETGVEPAQYLLHRGLNMQTVEEWSEDMLTLVERLFKSVSYSMDTVATFVRGEYSRPTMKRSDESDEHENDEVYKENFILFALNKTDQPKKALVFDYVEKEIRANTALDPIINTTSPLMGFFFPAFNDNNTDVNHLLFSVGKVNDPISHITENVLNCEETVTAAADKENFGEILHTVLGKRVTPSTIGNIYNRVNELIVNGEEEEPLMLDVQDVENLLTGCGVEDVKNVRLAFENVLDDAKGTLKATSLIPSFTSKSIKINTKVADVSISPKDVGQLKQINHRGKRMLLIELDESAILEGFELETEKL